MQEQCKVTFDGSQGGEYYTACSTVKYINQHLINTGNNLIELRRDNRYDSFIITCHSNRYCSYSDSYRTYYISNATNVRFNDRSLYYRNIDYIYLFGIFIMVVSSLVKMLRNR